MAFDLQEQEQIESLKAFWQLWGKWIAGGVLALALAYVGYVAWGMHRAQQVSAAAQIYSAIEQSAQGQDLNGVRAGVTQIEFQYAATPYAPRAAFLAAKIGFDKNDLVYASEQLNWVIAHAKESSLVTLAQLRLASVQLDEKQYNAALASLDKTHDAAFDALYFDARGDVLTLKGDKDGARDAYQSALAKLANDAPDRQYVQTKLDALGG